MDESPLVAEVRENAGMRLSNDLDRARPGLPVSAPVP
jgi:hypothetical protein